MTFTAVHIKLPAQAQVRPGQFARFAANGMFIRVEDRLTNGLGVIYQANADGSFSRFYF